MRGSLIILLLAFSHNAFPQAPEMPDVNKRDQIFHLLDSLHVKQRVIDRAHNQGFSNAAAPTFIDSLRHCRTLNQEAGFECVDKIICNYGWPDPSTISFRFYNAFKSFLINAPSATRRTILNQLTYCLVKINSYNYAAMLKESLENKPFCSGQGWATTARGKMPTEAVDKSLPMQYQQTSLLLVKSFSEIQQQSINLKLQNEINTLRPTRQY